MPSLPAALRLVATVALLTGCAASIRVGQTPPIEQLAGLRGGVSSKEQVLAALGPPQGKGAAEMAKIPSQDVWTYMLTEAAERQVRLRILMVFIDRESERFDGYMWFSSGQVMGANR